MGSPRSRASELRLALAAAALGACTLAQAQWSGSVRVDSDYRFRGVSLSDGRPDAQLTLAYDHPSGWYGGAALTRVQLLPGQHSAQLLGYAGYARAGTGDWPGWEAGATTVHFSGIAGYGYGEVYAGLIGQGWNARLYHAPNYFGRGTRTLYAELNGSWPLNARWRVSGHAGVLRRLHDATPYDDEPRQRADGRLALGCDLDRFDLQLAWVATQRGGLYPAVYGGKRNALVLSLAASF